MYGKKTNLQFVSTADMQKDAKDLSLKFLPYSLLISISVSYTHLDVYKRQDLLYLILIITKKEQRLRTLQIRIMSGIKK